MYAPNRGPVSPAMFPHTATLYTVVAETDHKTMKSRSCSHITVLRGVLLAETRGVSIPGDGPLSGGDRVKLYVPFGAEASDGVTGVRRTYVPPVEFRRAQDRDRLWTALVDGGSFLVRGRVVEPELTRRELERDFGGVYSVTSVAQRDFGGLPHWQIGGA